MLPEVVHFPRRHEEGEADPETLADTLVVFGKTELDKHRIKLDDPSRYAAFVANRLLSAKAAKRIEFRSPSIEGLALMESYFDKFPTSKKSLSGKIASNTYHEIKELEKITLNKNYGSVALVTAGPVDKIISQGLNDKGIKIESFSPEQATEKIFVDSSTNSFERKVETALLFIRALTSKLPDIRFNRLTPISANT